MTKWVRPPAIGRDDVGLWSLVAGVCPRHLTPSRSLSLTLTLTRPLPLSLHLPMSLTPSLPRPLPMDLRQSV